MKKKFEIKSLLKWTPVLFAAVVAAVQAVGEQKEADRVDDLEERINNLEKNEES